MILVLAGALFVAGLTGLLFSVWPTSWPDQPLQITASELAVLRHLREEPKFYANQRLFYPGAPNEAMRVSCEVLVNHLLSDLIDNLPAEPRKARVLSAFKATLSVAERLDSEDQDRIASYLEETLGILNIKSSNELINVWRYGFPYGWFVSSR